MRAEGNPAAPSLQGDTGQSWEPDQHFIQKNKTKKTKPKNQEKKRPANWWSFQTPLPGYP